MRSRKVGAFLAAIVVAFVLAVALLLSGCGSTQASGDEGVRFVASHKKTDLARSIYVITDCEMGCQYLCVEGSEKCGLTLLVDTDGKPMVDKRFTDGD